MVYDNKYIGIKKKKIILFTTISLKKPYFSLVFLPPQMSNTDAVYEAHTMSMSTPLRIKCRGLIDHKLYFSHSDTDRLNLKIQYDRGVHRSD